MPSRNQPPASRNHRLDALVATLTLTAYIAWIYRFRYQGLLGEDDLYRVLIGLLDGARRHNGLASPNHYGKAFSFGYIAAIYRLASPQTLADAQRLIPLINTIGLVSAAAGSALFWMLAWMLYGPRRASLALILFALSPMILELGTSGHPILPAFALLAASALCLLAPLRGRLSMVLAIAGALLLTAALTTRAEVGLAIPFLIAARTDFSARRSFVLSALRRSIAPASAVAAFLALKHFCADATAGSGQLIPFLRQFIRIREIPVGVYVFTLSCGIATTAAALLAGALAARRRATPNPPAALYAAPLALIAFPLAFFLANPRPGRHFILCLAGLSILLAGRIERRCARQPLLAYALALSIVVANQALAALTGPLILRFAPSKILPSEDGAKRLPRGVPTGTSWAYHRAFTAEQQRTNAFAALVAQPCDDNTLVMSLDATQIFAGLSAASTQWDPTERPLAKFPMLQAHIGSRAVLVLSDNEGWPADAAAMALTDPTLRGYKLIRDPNSLSLYDRTVIPPDRAAHLGCAAR